MDGFTAYIAEASQGGAPMAPHLAVTPHFRRRTKRNMRWDRFVMGWVFPEGRGVPYLAAGLWFVSVGTESRKIVSLSPGNFNKKGSE